MSDFLYELLYLIHCKHFVDVFSPIIVIVTSRNIFLCFNEKNKTLNLNAIFHISNVQILHNEPFNKIRGTVGSISD